MKRRLFQSLIGHPLFRIFSEDVLEQEFNQVARAHFESCITIENVNAIHCAIEAVMTRMWHARGKRLRRAADGSAAPRRGRGLRARLLIRLCAGTFKATAR